MDGVRCLRWEDDMMPGPLHPILAEGIVAMRRADLVRYRSELRMCRNVPHHPSPGRERLGWLLVETGLRLAVPGPRQAGHPDQRP